MKIGHIPGHFNTRSGRIWLTNYMSALQAWPNRRERFVYSEASKHEFYNDLLLYDTVGSDK